MKKTILFVFGLFIFGLLLPWPALAQAPEPEPTPTAIDETLAYLDESTAMLPFAALDYLDDDLVSPYDMTSVRFSIPSHWRLAAGGEVVLEYEVFTSGSDIGLLSEARRDDVGVLAVTFNGKKIDDINLSGSGTYTTALQLPADALVSRREDGRHELEILLNADVSCRYDIRTRVLMKANSYFLLPFETAPPDLNLSQLPAPFYLRDALLPERTILVVPDDPAAGELQAALNLTAGLGSLTGADFTLEMLTASQLTDEVLPAANLIFVGRPAQFARLSEIEFSLPVEAGRFAALDPAYHDDGVIQLAPSPWNESKTVLLVSGTSTAAVNKSAQAISAGNLFVTDDPALVLVADINSVSDAIPIVEKFTFKDLGYTTETMAEIGLNTLDYSFFLAKEQVRATDGYIDLIYFHSDLLGNDQNSSMLVSLNGETISSVSFADGESNLKTLRIEIPPGMLRFGENQIRIKADLLPITDCDYAGLAKYFVTVLEDTLIHIPAAPALGLAPALSLDLKMLLEIFLTHSELDNLAFVLPEDDPASWQIAAQLALLLGNEGLPLIPQMGVHYERDVPDESVENRSLIFVGKPSEIALLREINDALPAPFDFEQDTASDAQMQVVFRIPPDVSVGYLELFPSPYNLSEAMLVVAGNTDEGVQLAGSALLDSSLRRQLSGRFVVTNGEQIIAGTRFAQPDTIESFAQEDLPAPTAIPPADPGDQEAIKSATATPVVTLIQGLSDPPALERPDWLMPVILVSMGVLLLVVAYLIVSVLLQKRAAQAQLEE